MTRRTRTRQPGFSLLEVVIAAGILTLAVAALTEAVVAGQMQTYAALRQERAVALGESMIEEILSKPYPTADNDAKAGPDHSGQSRADFDTIDDYDGFTEAAGSLTTATGQSYPADQQDYSIRVSAKSGDSPDVPSLGGVQPGITLTVTVTDRTGQSVTLTRFVPQPADASEGG